MQLFSGGDEAVLVIWQLESRDLNFLPRLGGALNTIRTSRDGMSLCVCCDNNAVRVVNITTLATIWQQSGLTILANSATKYRKRCGNAIVDPITDAVVIPTCNGGAGASLQFWNAKDDTCMALLDVSYRNRVSERRVDVRIEHLVQLWKPLIFPRTEVGSLRSIVRNVRACNVREYNLITHSYFII